jgi:hypothetical protein
MIDIDRSPQKLSTMIDNVLKVYAQATPGQRASGRAWYPQAHVIACRVGGGNVAVGASVLAALSPQTLWSLNVEQAYEVSHLTDADRVALESGDRSPLAGRALNRQPTARVLLALKLQTGALAPYDGLGLKTRAFALLIAEPDHVSAVVIDAHAHDIAHGVKLQHKVPRGLGAVGRYELLADVYREAAAIVGCLPSVLQATTWETWRELGGNIDGAGHGRHGAATFAA